MNDNAPKPIIDHDRVRTQRLSLYVAIVVCFSTVCSMLSNNASTNIITSAIDAANYYAWYQAKQIRHLAGEVPKGATLEELRLQGDKHTKTREEATRQNNLLSLASVAFNAGAAIGAVAILGTGLWLISISAGLTMAGIALMGTALI
jgi:hypothetical protein